MFLCLVVLSAKYNAQELNFYPDTVSYKKSLFEMLIRTKNVVNLKYIRFKDGVKFGGHPFLTDSIMGVKTKLKQRFNSSVARELTSFRPIDDLFTSWIYTYQKNYPDSVIFIWDWHVDDFFHEQDSLSVTHNSSNYGAYLWTIEPCIFSITNSGVKRDYAIICSYYQKSQYFPYGNFGQILLYERRSRRWEQIETLYQW